MWTWVLLLAAVVFFMYMWSKTPMYVPTGKQDCNTCGKGKNVSIE